MRELIKVLHSAQLESVHTIPSLAKESGLSESALVDWFHRGKTNALAANVSAVAQCLGYELKLVRVVDKPESE